MNLKEILDMALNIEPSAALSQELVLMAFDAGKHHALKNGIRANVVLNKKRQISYVSNYQANATVIMDENLP